MTTSGTFTFHQTRNALINAAFRIAGIIDPDVGTASTNQLSYGGQALDSLLKYLESYGLQLWERRYGVIFPQKSQTVYVLGSPGPAGDHACVSTPLGYGFVDTTLASAAASGASTISVTTTTSGSTVGTSAVTMTSGYNIGVELDSGSMQWTTINGAPSGTTITLTATLTGAASAGNVVRCYQTKMMRPLRILDGFTRKSTGNDIPHLIIPRENYNRFGVKSSAGVSIQTYYDPQRDSGNLYIYPTTTDVSDLIYIEFQRPYEDMTGASDDLDMPQEWTEVVRWMLAYRVGMEYGTPPERLGMIKKTADEVFAVVDGWDQEVGSVFIQPNTWMYDSNLGNK